MSNIITNINDLNPVIDIMNYINKNNIDFDIIKETLELFIKKDENNNNLTNYQINKKKYIEYASFNPKYNSITMSIDGINKYIERTLKIFKNEDIDIKKLYCYFYIYCFSHEIEHSIQYLMKDNIISTYPIIQKSYQELFNIIIKKDTLIPNPIIDTYKHISYILYQINHDNYFFERNATLEGFDLLLKIATYNEDKQLIKLFKYTKKLLENIGYNEKYNGSIEETFKRTLRFHIIKKELYKDYNISFEERVRYGLPITEKEKKLLLKK